MTNINVPEPPAAVAALLARHPLLSGLPPDVAAELLLDASALHAAAGQILFREGDEARHYLLVESGQAEVMRYSYNGDERVFRVFEPGQLMAEAAMFMPHGRYPMQARARSDVLCWRLSRKRLHDACRRWPDLALKLLAGMSKAVYDQVNKVDWMTSSSAAERLANYLVGLQESQGSELTLPLSQRQLAGQLGIRPETLSRLLTDWQTQGYISGKRRQWVLHDPAYLAGLSLTARRPF
jgi:CRP-like cAMP-binding protein